VCVVVVVFHELMSFNARWHVEVSVSQSSVRMAYPFIFFVQLVVVVIPRLFYSDRGDYIQSLH